MAFKTIKEMIEEDKKKAKWFIGELVKRGILRSAVATNDFDTNLVPRVYITIPYGRVGGGKQKGYQRWNDNTVKHAVKFWKANSKKNPKRR